MVLSAFFDETHSPKHEAITAVAGFLFEPERLADLHTQWANDPLIRRMPWPHASHCHEGNKKFESYLYEERMALMQRVAEITSEARGPGFVCEIEDNEFRDCRASYSQSEAPFENAYSACVFGVVGMVRAHLEKTGKEDEQVSYWFESGDPGQRTCDDMLRRIRQDQRSREYFRMYDYRFASKESDPGFACADALAWEWQRNRAEALSEEMHGLPDSGYRKVFKAFFKNDFSPPIHHIQATKPYLRLAELTAFMHNLDQD